MSLEVKNERLKVIVNMLLSSWDWDAYSLRAGPNVIDSNKVKGSMIAVTNLRGNVSYSPQNDTRTQHDMTKADVC